MLSLLDQNQSGLTQTQILETVCTFIHSNDALLRVYYSSNLEYHKNHMMVNLVIKIS